MRNDTVHEYFTRHAEKIQICYFLPIVAVEPIQEGCSYSSTLKETKKDKTARTDGFLLQISGQNTFLTDAAFREKYQPIGDWLKTSKTRVNLPENTYAEQVPKGVSVKAHASYRAWDKTSFSTSEDGWLVSNVETGRISFIDDITFRSIYNTDTPLPDSLSNLYRSQTLTNDTVLYALQVEKDFMYRNADKVNCNVSAGSFILQIPNTLPREYSIFTEAEFYRGFITKKPKDKNFGHNKVINVDFRSKKRQPKI